MASSGLKLFAVLLFFSAAAHAQPGLDAYNRGDLEAVRSYLAKNKNSTAETDFLRAALTEDADSAAEMYRQVAVKYPESPVTDLALERLGQYYYAKGLYTKADEVKKSGADLKSLPHPNQNPDTATRQVLPPREPEPESIKVAEAPVQAPPKVEPVAAISQPKPNSPGAPQLAVGKSAATGAPQLAVGSSGYILQLGAFARPDNVMKLKASLEQAGYTLEIFPATIGGKKCQAIRAVGFKDEASAQAALQEMKKKYGLNPILLPPGHGK